MRKLRLQVLHTPGHSAGSVCLATEGVVFTDDTLLIGGTGHIDLPSGTSNALYGSLFILARSRPAVTATPGA